MCFRFATLNTGWVESLLNLTCSHLGSLCCVLFFRSVFLKRYDDGI